MKDISIMIGKVEFNFRVGLMIEREDKILIEKNPEFPFTNIPGGRVKTLEDTQTALIREIKEEMGIDISNDKLIFKSIIENFFVFDNKEFHELFFLYKLKKRKNDKRFKENMVNIDSEANYYKWIYKKDIGKINLVPTKIIELNDNNKFERLLVKDIKKSF